MRFPRTTFSPGRPRPLFGALLLALVGACSSTGFTIPDGDTSTGDGADLAGGGLPPVDMAPLPFAADPPAVYVAKVKNLLVGLPPTDGELMQVQKDPTALAGLIDGWMATPEYQQKMLVFFELAFEQTQITSADFIDIIPKNGIGAGPAVPALVQNVRESFARTVLAFVESGRPLTDAFTTHQLMMTPALMELYAFLDTWRTDDNAVTTDVWAKNNKGLKFQVSTKSGPIALADTLDPKSPNYMHWYSPDAGKLTYPTDPTCNNIDPIVWPADSFILHWLLYGAVYNHPGPNGNCGTRSLTAASVQLADTDFTTWKMVTMRAPKQGEAITTFYDLPSLRAATELVLNTPRPGFFSTPAFFANWPTNQSNQMRVTVNQALIVATGMQVDGTDLTVPPSTPGLDQAHSMKNTPCYGCHQLLDPTRAVMSSAWSYFYNPQTDPLMVMQTGLFAFQGVVKQVNSIDDFAQALAQHPAVAAAWVQKVCYWANSAPCAPGDPEFLRIVSDFQAGNFSFHTLLRELLSSPITTHTAPTVTSMQTGEVIAVARRDHLCAALDNRLGLSDVCALDVTSKKGSAGVVPSVAAGLPSDGYGRGSTIPVLPNDPTLFYRAGVENICEAVAQLVIDSSANPMSKHWSSKQPDAAIADFVSLVMGLPPSDPRAMPAQMLLSQHFQTASAMPGIAATDALRSTFIVACLSPSAAGIGL